MFLQARVSQRNAFPKGKARGVWLLNVVLAACGQAVPMSCVENPNVWSGGSGLPSPVGRRGELWTGDTDGDELRQLSQQSAIS